MDRKTKKKIFTSVLYALCFLVCLTDLSRLFPLAVLFLLLLVLNIASIVRNPTKLKKEDSKAAEKFRKEKFRTQREQEYNARLDEIDKEFDFEIEDYLDEDEGE